MSVTSAIYTSRQLLAAGRIRAQLGELGSVDASVIRPVPGQARVNSHRPRLFSPRTPDELYSPQCHDDDEPVIERFMKLPKEMLKDICKAYGVETSGLRLQAGPG